MEKNNVIGFRGTEDFEDVLTSILRTGAQDLIREAVKAEFQDFMGQHKDLKLENGYKRVVKNGNLPAREIQTGVGSVRVEMPRCRDRESGKIKFTSKILPRYLRRTKSVEELIPWLYLKGISSNDFQEALEVLLGKGVEGLSASTIGRLKSKWVFDVDRWRKQDLSKKKYLYLWADGIHCGIRGEDNKMCLLVLLGVNEYGEKELVAIDDGYRESAESWLDILRNLKTRGLNFSPELAIGDGALGFWKALSQVFPETKTQRCWQHKTVNIQNHFPKSMRGKVLESIHGIWMAESRIEALKAWNRFISSYGDKYPKAVECLEKDKLSLLTFYDFPAEHWKSIRTTNPIESIFATVRHRTNRAKGCVARSTMLALAFKLVDSASKNWARLEGAKRFGELITGVKFTDGRSELDILSASELEAKNSRLAA